MAHSEMIRRTLARLGGAVLIAAAHLAPGIKLSAVASASNTYSGPSVPVLAASVVGDGTPASCDQPALHNALAGGGLVTFNCGGPKTIDFTTAEIITMAVTIDGGNVITLSGNVVTRLFEINSGAALTLENIVLDQGFSTSGDGGAISNSGALVVENSTIQGSQADFDHSGGAIFTTGPVTITNSTLSGNSAGSAGALFANLGSAKVVIANSIFHHNSTFNYNIGYGGAIWVGTQARLSFTGGAIYSNTAQIGGALYLSPGAVVTLTSSTAANPASAPHGGVLQVRFNSAQTNGGAVFNDSGELHVAGALFEANHVPTSTVSGGNGGAIYSEVSLAIQATVFLANVAELGGGVMVGGPSITTATTTISDSAFIGNWADGAGGGLFNASRLTLHNTHFLSNTSGNIGGGAYSIGSVSTNGGLFRNNQCTGIGCSGGGLNTDGALALTGTQFISNTSHNIGGGAYPVSGATLIGGRFENNHCTATVCRGGGLFTDGPLVATGTAFVGNLSDSDGGGAYAAGGGTVTAGLFERNTCQPSTLAQSEDGVGHNQPAAAGCDGGALYAGGVLTLTATHFLSNTSLNDGGAVYAEGAVRLVGGLFQGNRCTRNTCLGGGFRADGPVTLTATRFISNSAAHGGALALRGGDNLIVNGLFARNSAGGSGAALNIGPSTTATVLHATIAGPSLAGAAAIFVDSFGSLGVTNTIITSHTFGILHFAGAAYEDYNLFFGVLTPTVTGGVISGGHSFTANPAFAGPASDDYHLRAGSPAREAGVDVDVSADFEGDPRPLDAGFDIGFDEFALRTLYLPLVMR